MLYTIAVRGGFDAAHQLDETVGGSACFRNHGHHWQVEVRLRGTMGPRKQPNRERLVLEDAVAALCREYHGRDLGQMMPASPSTPEHIALLFLERLSFNFDVSAVTVWQDESSSITVEREAP